MCWKALALAASLALGTSPALSQEDGEILREGTGERRERLDGMELNPFPREAWTGLAQREGGEPFTTGATEGKVVLLFTWSSWYPPSLRIIPRVQELYEAHRDRGLIVVGVHHERGWEGAGSVIESRGMTFPVVHDAGNALRTRLLVDQDPDFYLIDRGGNLRFADIDARSLETGIARLLEESVEAASDLPSLLSRREAQRRTAMERTVGINQELAGLADLPADIPFVPPSPEAYELIDDWRVLNEDMLEMLGQDSRRARSRSEDDDEELIRIPLSLPEGASFHPERPVTSGRILAVYFWHPQVRDSFWPTMNEVDGLQRRYGRDVVFVGVMVPESVLRGERGGRRRGDEPRETAEELKDAFDGFIRTRVTGHTLMLDAEGSILGSFGGRRGRGDQALARMMIVATSDGFIRWVGPPASARSPIEGLLRRDPGVEARRKAEQAYIDGRR